MTTVHISLGRDDGTDQTAAKGVVEWEPTTRREDGTMVILERGFTVPLVEGEATVTVDPSGLTWCWRVTERTDSGGVVRYVSVPDSATAVEYVDLPDVDPTTLVAWAPADPEAAYQSALDNLDVAAAVAAYLLANPVSAPVSSVNGKVGAVALDADDVGADPAGTAADLVAAVELLPGPEGPAGADGAPGADGLPGADGDDGREIELQTSATHVQWRYVGDVAWTDLIALSAITGPAGADGAAGVDGDDGLSVELRTTATHVQWRHVGDATWTDLAALADLGSQTYASLDDVDLTDLADGDAMVWDATAGKWVRASLSSTYAPIPTGTPDGTKYLRDDNTWAVPVGTGGGGATVTWVTLTAAAQEITLPAPTAGTQLIVVLTQDATGNRTATWPAEVIWEGGAIPSVPSGPSERAVFTLLGAASGVWLGFLSGMFAAPVVPDTTAPTPGTLTASLITSSSFRLTATGSGDNVALHAQPYRFSIDNGVSYGAWQVSPDADFTGRTASTAYTCLHQVRDAAGNTSTGSPITATTLAASVPAITDSFNRADSTSGLGQTDTGQTWEQVGTGIVGILGGAAYRASSNAIAVVNFGQADMWVTHKVVVTGDYFAGHIARYVDGNNYYTFDTSSAGGTGNVKVSRVIGGTQIAVGGAVIPSVAAGDTIGSSYKEVAGGTEIKVYKNGTLIATVTDSTAGRPMGTKAGIKPYNNVNIRLDDFSVRVPE